LLPFTVDQGRVVVAHVSGLDPLVIKRAAKDWLADTQLAAFRNFLYLKQARTDAETGLFNSANLFCLLDTLSDYQLLHLVLVELPPRNRSPRDAFQNARKAAFVLQGFAGGGLLHHLGQCVFAILLQNPGKEESNARFGSSLVASLKREGFHRVHIGSSRGTKEARTETAKRDARDRLLAEAWSVADRTSELERFYETDLLPLAEQSVQAALLAYRSNRAMIDDVIAARRAALETSLKHLRLAADRAQAQYDVEYLAGGARNEQ